MIDIDYLKSVPVLDVVELPAYTTEDEDLYSVILPLGWELCVYDDRVSLWHGRGFHDRCGNFVDGPCAVLEADLESLGRDAWDGEVEDPDADTLRRMWKDLWDMRGDLEELAEKYRDQYKKAAIELLDWSDLA